MNRQARRAARACMICHKKKVRCDIDSVGGACTNCVRDDYECQPRQRKRKRYTISASPPARTAQIRRIDATTSEAFEQLPPHEESPSTPNASLGAGEVLSYLQEGSTTGGQTNIIQQRCYATPNTILSSEEVATSPPKNGSAHTPVNVSYLGRLEYLRNDVPVDDETAIPCHAPHRLSETDRQILQIQRVSELPPRSIRECLLDAFWTRCYPWTPVVDKRWVEDRPVNQISLLLLHAMLLAGSRVSKYSPSYTPGDFYKRARVLFWMGAEDDPIVTTAAACLLHWWNPEGPERISLDTSGFWLRIAVGLAYQIGLHKEPTRQIDAGLRRRIWWSLVVRDCLINAGHGRPRAIDLRLTDVSLPSMSDFDGVPAAANLFSAYVAISSILGDLTQSFLQKCGFRGERAPLEDRLFRWIKSLPEPLQICHPQQGRRLKPYHFESRQLHVQYFTVLIILTRPVDLKAAPSTASLLASSFIAGIFEDFLSRDELRYLGPIFTFYLLAAGMALLSCYRYPELWNVAAKDLEIMFKALGELSKRWPSAVGSLKHLTDVRDKVVQQPSVSHLPENSLTSGTLQFFEDFGPELCRMWKVIYEGASKPREIPTGDLETAGILQDLRTPGAQFENFENQNMSHPQPSWAGQVNGSLEPTSLQSQDWLSQYDGIGNWLLIDWDQGLG